jgi:imidazolonepropionase-like amidohydrolase
MDSERVLEDQVVIVEDGLITAVGPAGEVTIPDGAEIVDGQGGYLMPGLADMHAHLLENQDAMILYLANGVTTIRNLSALPHILTWRDQVAAGELLGPTIRPGKRLSAPPVDTDFLVYRLNRAAGPFFSFNTSAFGFTADAAEGRQQVLQAKADGYEFIKINYLLSRETFDSIVTTAAEVDLPVRAHVPADVGVEHMVRSGAEIQHSYSLMSYVAKDYVRRPGANVLDRFDLSEADQKLPELAALMAENGVDFTPTLVPDVIINRMFDDAQEVIQQQPAYRYVPPSFMRTWRNPMANPEVRAVVAGGQLPERAYRDEVQAYNKRQVKALHDGGVRILAGTDANVLGVIWGFTMPEELELFVEAGLTPYQALEAATRLPAEVFGNPEEWGTVEVGKRADLLLLQANPLADISSIRQIVGVMARGRWLPQAELQGMLDEIAAKYQVQEAQMAQQAQQAQEAQQAQMEAPIELEPFSGPYFSGLTPAGWNELEPGVYARSNPEVDPTLLLQMSAPGMSAESFGLAVLADFGVTELPEPMDSYESAALAWTLY